MAHAIVDSLVSRNPATGEELGSVAATPVEEVAEAVARAREAQAHWGRLGWPERKVYLKRWWKILSRDAEILARLIRDEVGKPRAEALAGDVIATLDALRWTVRHSGKVLREERVGAGHQRFLMLPAGRLSQRPLGVVGMIGTWNYPLFLNAPPIAQALAAGNAVVWKPSELAPLVGRRIEQSLEEAEMPKGLVGTVQGGSEVGRALVEAPIDKGFFTGGIENGRRVLSALASRGISAVAELSGFDPAIVLSDAPLVSTSRALAWASFVGAGQTCVAVKRIYIVGDPAAWVEALATQAASLRVGNPANEAIDLGPMITESAREKFHASIRAAVNAGAELITGGEPMPGPGSFYRPTVLLGRSTAPENCLTGVFGPVVIVRGVPDVESAIAAVNENPFGLGASVWSKNVRAASALAARLDAGMVTINEAVSPTMHAAAPFGGTKASGFGRTHGTLGLREFTQTQVVFPRSVGGFRPHYFPYGVLPVDTVFRLYRRLFH